jgi:hypothetical protein
MLNIQKEESKQFGKVFTIIGAVITIAALYLIRDAFNSDSLVYQGSIVGMISGGLTAFTMGFSCLLYGCCKNDPEYSIFKTPVSRHHALSVNDDVKIELPENRISMRL